jgi:hypothetical protein
LTLLTARFFATDFKWEDVKGDKYRENYLGHSQVGEERWRHSPSPHH